MEFAFFQSLWGKVGEIMGDGRGTRIEDMSAEDINRLYYKCWCMKGEGSRCDTCFLYAFELQKRGLQPSPSGQPQPLGAGSMSVREGDAHQGEEIPAPKTLKDVVQGASDNLNSILSEARDTHEKRLLCKWCNDAGAFISRKDSKLYRCHKCKLGQSSARVPLSNRVIFTQDGCGSHVIEPNSEPMTSQKGGVSYTVGDKGPQPSPRKSVGDKRVREVLGSDRQVAISNATRMMDLIGLDLSREGRKETPKRFVAALEEMTKGYDEDPKEILSKQFEEHSDEMIVLRGIEFCSVCEHHLLPFVGTADVGYLPGKSGKVVGLSKLARLVDCLSRRLQMQERLTREIATALMENLQPLGAACVIRAKHMCMGCRGVKKPDAEFVTSCTLGVFRSDATVRAEFLILCKGG